MNGKLIYKGFTEQDFIAYANNGYSPTIITYPSLNVGEMISFQYTVRASGSQQRYYILRIPSAGKMYLLNNLIYSSGYSFGNSIVNSNDNYTKIHTGWMIRLS